jgi:LAO/AO transport system kinase
MTPDEVIAGVRAGERRALGRAISMVERLGPEGREVVRALHPDAGRAWRVGLTGPPGTGKSTLAAALVRRLRDQGRKVAVVSVDPSSPFTRGAVLGDRIRLADHFLDAGVFIRSMASRGQPGGVAEATADAVLVLDAAGFDVVMLESVGAGQTEVDAADLVETLVLALMPGSGDSVQAIKAGLMEVPDVIAITKADLPGADALRSDLRSALTLVPGADWTPPLVPVKALAGEGVEALWEAVEAHRAHLAVGDRLAARRRAALARRLRSLALARLGRRLRDGASPELVDALVEEVAEGALDPATAVDRVLAEAGLAPARG